MKITKEGIALVVKKVLTYYVRRQFEGNRDGKLLVIIPEFPIGFDELFSELELREKASNVDFITAAADLDFPKESKVFRKGVSREELELLKNLGDYERLDILTPTLGFLKDLRDGKESDLFSRIALWFVMTDRKIMVRLPYGTGDLPEGKFGQNTHKLLDDLSDMGVGFTSLDLRLEELIKEMDGGNDGELITEETVRMYDSAGIKAISVKKGSIVTPLAREAAKEIGIVINE